MAPDAACVEAIRQAKERNPVMLREALRADVTYKFEKDRSISPPMIRVALSKLAAILGFEFKDLAAMEGRGQQVVFAVREDASLVRDGSAVASTGAPSVPRNLHVFLASPVDKRSERQAEPLSLEELRASLVPVIRSDLSDLNSAFLAPEEMARRISRIEESLVRLREKATAEERQDLVRALDDLRVHVSALRSALATGILSHIRDEADGAQNALDRLPQ